MRKSLQDISFMVRDIPYHTPLPEDIAALHCYVTDSGHCILAIPEPLAERARNGDPQMFEVPLPVRYVLENGWMHMDGTDSIIVPVAYDSMLGALVPAGYDEF